LKEEAEMSAKSLTTTTDSSPIAKKTVTNSTFTRLARYTVVRFFTMAITVTIGVYLTILIANMGGYVDTIMRNEIRDTITQAILASPNYRSLSQEAKQELIQKKIAAEEARIGLDKPFAVRSMIYLRNGLTLNLGRALYMTSDHGSKEVRLILLERLPATLLLTGTTELFLFFGSVFIALSLSRKVRQLVR
jgi:peptide/nickel transport system permease protein